LAIPPRWIRDKFKQTYFSLILNFFVRYILEFKSRIKIIVQNKRK